MSRFAHAVCLIFGCTTFLPLAARAHEFGSTESLYSDGVQAYFGGRCGEAESLFSSVAGMDPNDPRAFYFRALSLMRQGREDEARSDMEIGAQIEARFPTRFDIGKTLERVQGSNRLLLEQKPHTLTVFLDAPFEILFDRCVLQPDAAIRPVLKDPDAAAARFKARRPQYQRAAHIIVETEALTPAGTVARLIEELRRH